MVWSHAFSLFRRYPVVILPVRISLLLLLTGFEVQAASPTFHKDILPIFQKHCQSCHRPGEIAPMPFLTYQQVRPWAKSIRQSVKLKQMPPWFADPHFGKFINDSSLTEEEIAIITQWVDNGAPAGKTSDAPPPVQWQTGWKIRPDLILEMPQKFSIPAGAEIDYQYLILPWKSQSGETQEDRWVSGVQILPGDRRVVHHAVLYVREKDSPWLRDVASGRMYAPPQGDGNARIRSRDTREDILSVYTPGASVNNFPQGMAKKIPAGADLVLQLHYTSLAKENAWDQTKIALTWTTRPQKRLLTLQMGKDDLRIPPGDRNYYATVSGTLPNDALLISLFPHMHLRGKAFDFEIVESGGRVEPLLKVKQFDLNWQLSYILQQPRFLPKGTRLQWTGYFDNSAANPNNPDPEAEVRWGEQSWEEMMIGFFDIAVDPDIDKKQFFIR